MEKLSSLFKTEHSEHLNTPITFTVSSISPHSYNGKVYEDKVDVVLKKDGVDFLWSGVEKKKLRNEYQGKVKWEAKLGDEIDVTLRPPVANGKYSWYYVCAKGFYKPAAEDTVAVAQDVFAPSTHDTPKRTYNNSRDHIGIRGIFQALLGICTQSPSDEEVLNLIDRAIEIDEMLKSRI
jgi:hypothetical protein